MPPVGHLMHLSEKTFVSSPYRHVSQCEDRFNQNKIKSAIDGLPIGIKDNFCTKDLRTTCCSHMLEPFVPKYNATVVERTENAGGIVLGKTNMDEFGMGSGSIDSIFGPVKARFL